MERKDKKWNSFAMISKKGSIADTFVVPVVIFTLAIIVVLGLYLGNTISTNLIPHINSSQAAVDAVNNVTAALPTFDYFFLAVFIGLILAAIVSGFLIDAHPIFALLFFIMMIIATVVAVPLSNAYEALTSDPLIAPSAAQFPIINAVMSHLPLIALIIGILMIIVIYAKSQYGSGGVGI